MTIIDKDSKEKSKNYYLEITVLAAQNLNSSSSSPLEAWESAANYYYPNSEKKSARVKVCPRVAFLSLCKEGCVKAVSPENYTSSVEIREKAIEGLKTLIRNPNFTLEELKKLFREKNERKDDQGIMNVVFGLFKGGFIRENLWSSESKEAE